MTLTAYQKKRDFSHTPEPSGEKRTPAGTAPRFVIQKHAASRLHYDFRLEMDGVLKSWAVPKGPSLDPNERSLAVHVEDHPLEYAGFEGVIPQGEYGGGTVMVWDRGVWKPEGDPLEAYKRGKLKFRLEGEKLHGAWSLVRMGGKASDGGKNWLLIKKNDSSARPNDEHRLLEKVDFSVLSKRTLQQIASDSDRVWSSRSKRNGSSGNGSVGSAVGRRAPASEIPGAVKRPFPKSFKPQLATLVSEVPRGDSWIHELKFDGYRILGHCDGHVRLLTRRGNDWTDQFPTVAKAVGSLGLQDTILDGEVVVLGADGASDFQALQNVLNSGQSHKLTYYVFDAPYMNGYDLTAVPQIARKEALRQLLADQPANGIIRFSDHIRGQGSDVVNHACKHALEGVICKRVDAPYEQRRSNNWVKVKCLKRQEFVVGGWTNPSGSRIGFGALLLGYYEDGEFQYAGRVGTGYNEQSLREISQKLKPLEIQYPAYAHPPKGAAARDVHWVRPRLIAEVEFTQWTDDGSLRHPSFKGLREDKVAQDIVREEPTSSPKLSSPMPRTTKLVDGKIAGVQITNPDRVVYPDQGVTKLELASYYAEYADWILPYVVQRPVTVVRCPQGRTEKCFYQKHVTESLPAQVESVEIREESGVARYITISNKAGLIALIQMGVLEFHPWGSRNDKLDKPDLIVFDLDPSPEIPWQQMIDAAREVRERLLRAGLENYLRTSGGKGLHVVAPLTRRTGWDVAKRFAKGLAEAMANDSPNRYVATSSKAKREGKIYVDYLRNGEGATAIASYSTRARPNAPIATPLSWSELTSGLRADKYTIRSIAQRLSSLRSDPWSDFFDQRQSITKKALKSIGIG